MTSTISITGIIKVPPGFLGLGTPRYFYKDDVEVIDDFQGSCSTSTGAPITFRTKEGEVLKGYEQFTY